MFTYLAAMVSTALVHHGKKDSKFDKVLPYFRQRVQHRAERYWRLTDNEFDKVIIECSDSLAKLIFTDSKTNPAMGYDWPREWLQRFGVEEHNPATLFMITYRWKVSYAELVKMLNGLKIT